jgi:hypothetical protein
VELRLRLLRAGLEELRPWRSDLHRVVRAAGVESVTEEAAPASPTCHGAPPHRPCSSSTAAGVRCCAPARSASACAPRERRSGAREERDGSGVREERPSGWDADAPGCTRGGCCCILQQLLRLLLEPLQLPSLLQIADAGEAAATAGDGLREHASDLKRRPGFDSSWK